MAETKLHYWDCRHANAEQAVVATDVARLGLIEALCCKHKANARLQRLLQARRRAPRTVYGWGIETPLDTNEVRSSLTMTALGEDDAREVAEAWKNAVETLAARRALQGLTSEFPVLHAWNGCGERPTTATYDEIDCPDPACVAVREASTRRHTREATIDG